MCKAVLRTPYTLFISDLHLSAERPHTTRLLLNFLESTARSASALYILGDLFEYWAGDDDIDSEPQREVCAALRWLSTSGTRLYFIHGNRDFLIAEGFATTAGVALLPDPCLINLYGRQALLMHGDLLCTDDMAYQQFRRQVRDPAWQHAFLSRPLADRRAQIAAARMRSESEKSLKTAAIMDVNAKMVEELLLHYNHPPLLIHGHTHRPGEHSVIINGHHSTRWVLSDWDYSGDCLYCDATSCRKLSVSADQQQGEMA